MQTKGQNYHNSHEKQVFNLIFISGVACSSHCSLNPAMLAIFCLAARLHLKDFLGRTVLLSACSDGVTE